MERSQSRISLSASFEALAIYFPCMNSFDEDDGGEWKPCTHDHTKSIRHLSAGRALRKCVTVTHLTSCDFLHGPRIPCLHRQTSGGGATVRRLVGHQSETDDSIDETKILVSADDQIDATELGGLADVDALHVVTQHSVICPLKCHFK